MGKQRVFRETPKVARWLPDIRAAKRQLGVDSSKYPDALILALIHVESSGDEYAHRPNSQFYGLLQQGTANAQDIGYANGKVNYGKGRLAIINFLRYCEQRAKVRRHEYRPEYIALLWKGGPGTLSKYKKLVRTSGKEAGRRFLAGRWGGSPLTYVRDFQNALEVWQNKTNEEIREIGDDFTQATIPSRSRVDTHWGKQRSVREMTPFDLASYVTPEELRKGIIAQFFYINEWHIVQLAQDEKVQTRKEKDSDQPPTVTDDELESLGKNIESGSGNAKDRVKSANLTDERKRYVQALVEAEFYRRRLSSRSVPVATGPFNPYPVAGFPGLIMSPGRPILGYITNVSHNINVSAGTGSTSVTMVSPRYWDEGEVWYWHGGAKSESPVMRNFPQWHNRLVVATNNVEEETFDRLANPTDLDRFYSFMLGTEGIEYLSNHAGKSSPGIIEKAIVDKDPGPLEVKEETLEIKEYNTAIASLDSKGRFSPGTLAHRFYGPIEPYDVNEATATVEDQIEYVERYGVKERELFVDFLKNKYSRVKGSGRLVLTGPTFGGDRINALQNQILEYMDDLEKRRLVGGV